jgi:ATP-binding cassette subfamily B protein
VIAIAHRLSTVRQFDRILVIGGGRLLQDGSPSDLAACLGPYRDLTKLEPQRRRSRRAA